MKSAEIQLAEALDALRAAGKLETFNEKSANIKSGAVEPRLHCAQAILKDIRIKKHNGTEFSEVAEAVDPREKLVKGYMITSGINEATARKVLGLPPAGLTRAQRAEYAVATACGISEADATRLCKKV